MRIKMYQQPKGQKLTSRQWKLYNFLKTHCIDDVHLSSLALTIHMYNTYGYYDTPVEKAPTQATIDTSAVRKDIKAIREYDGITRQIVYVREKGYTMATNTAEIEEQAFSLINRGLTSLNKGKKMLKDIGLDKQTRLKLSKYQQELINVLSDDLVGKK